MSCGIFLLCRMSQYHTIINNHNRRWKSIFQEENKFYVQKSSCCHVLDFNGCMTINDVNMTSRVQLEWSYIVA
jgi:hypothetical protein